MVKINYVIQKITLLCVVKLLKRLNDVTSVFSIYVVMFLLSEVTQKVNGFVFALYLIREV